MAFIELRNVTKTYGHGTPNEFSALRGVSLDIERGEFVAVMGSSGSGKSTLMNIIGCLDTLSAGQYSLDREAVTDKSAAELVAIRRTKIGFIFQNFNLLPRLSSVRNVELPLIYAGVRPALRRERAAAALVRVGLGAKLKYKPSMLSGGEQQRVAIARAVVNNPAVLLADEPTGNLDSVSGGLVLDVLDGLHRQGTTVIMVTHDPAVARRAQRTVTLHDGTIVR
ncbi:MAG: ABC transporter ATP-binding protein [Patescibacteria group bacterium]